MGSGTSAKEFFRTRNEMIFEASRNGAGVDELSHRFSLSKKSIERILREQRLAVSGDEGIWQRSDQSLSPVRGLWKKTGIHEFREVQGKRQREKRWCMADLPVQEMQTFLEPCDLWKDETRQDPGWIIWSISEKWYGVRHGLWKGYLFFKTK